MCMNILYIIKKGTTHVTGTFNRRSRRLTSWMGKVICSLASDFPGCVVFPACPRPDFEVLPNEFNFSLTRFFSASICTDKHRIRDFRQRSAFTGVYECKKNSSRGCVERCVNYTPLRPLVLVLTFLLFLLAPFL